MLADAQTPFLGTPSVPLGKIPGTGHLGTRFRQCREMRNRPAPTASWSSDETPARGRGLTASGGGQDKQRLAKGLFVSQTPVVPSSSYRPEPLFCLPIMFCSFRTGSGQAGVIAEVLRSPTISFHGKMYGTYAWPRGMVLVANVCVKHNMAKGMVFVHF